MKMVNKAIRSVAVVGVTLLFIFFPYEIAPYAVGNVRIELTDQEIRNLGAPIRW